MKKIHTRSIVSVFAVTALGIAAFLAGRISKTETPKFVFEKPEPVFLVNDGFNTKLNAVGATLFDAHHAKAVEIFDKQPGNGFRRIMPLLHHNFDQAPLPGMPSIFEDFDFTFIGNDAQSRLAENLKEQAGLAAVFVSQKRGESKMQSPSSADEVALAAFEKDDKLRREFHLDGDSLIGYGPLRAAKSCAKCHGVEEGTLLGAFRYTFELPLDLRSRDLAAVFSQSAR